MGILYYNGDFHDYTGPFNSLVGTLEILIGRTGSARFRQKSYAGKISNFFANVASLIICSIFCSAFFNLTVLKVAQRKSMHMINNEDIRSSLSKQAGLLILRSFQLMRAKIKWWSDINNPIKKRFFLER